MIIYLIMMKNFTEEEKEKPLIFGTEFILSYNGHNGSIMNLFQNDNNM